MNPRYFRFSLIAGIFFLLFGFISQITRHPGFALRMTYYSFIFLVLGAVFYILHLFYEKQK